MQTEEQRQKLDEVTGLVGQFADIANRLAQKFKVASPVYEVEDGSFQVARQKGSWELLWDDGNGVQELRSASMAVKRKFLAVAGAFFQRYVGMAQSWEKTIDEDIEKGREALTEVRKYIA